MKKVIYLILVLVFIGCQKRIVPYKSRDITPVNVGTAANDGTGDPLRTAMQKLNANDVIHSDSIYYLFNEIIDTITLNSIAPLWTDTTSIIATKTDLLSVGGGGGGATATNYKLQFRTDTTTGAPVTGDSIFTDVQLIGMHPKVFRGPAAHATNSGALLQQQNPWGVINVTDGFRFNSVTGQLIFRPPFTTNELVVIEYTNTILWQDVSITGQESSLLDNIIAYYDCDETSGTTLNDSHGSNDGTASGAITLGATGKLGYGVSFSGTTGSVSIPYSADLVPTDSIAISLWFKVSSLPTTLGHDSYIYRQRHGADPWESTVLKIYESGGSNYLYGKFVDADGDGFFVQYDTPITADTWYHVGLANRGNGNYIELWVDGVRVDETAGFDGSMYPATSSINIGNAYDGGEEGFAGVIDEVSIYNGLSPSEIVEHFNSDNGITYPFE